MADKPSLARFLEDLIDTDYNDGASGWAYVKERDGRLVIGFWSDEAANPDDYAWPDFEYEITEVSR